MVIFTIPIHHLFQVNSMTYKRIKIAVRYGVFDLLIMPHK